MADRKFLYIIVGFLLGFVIFGVGFIFHEPLIMASGMATTVISAVIGLMIPRLSDIQETEKEEEVK